VRRELVEPDYRDSSDPWFAEHQPDDQGLDAPSWHATRSVAGPATRVAVGDSIWIFSQLLTPWGNLPPALDAKLSVSGIAAYRRSRLQRIRQYRFTAGPGSKRFPLCDASACIERLRTRARTGEIRPLRSRPDQPIGQALLGMRELEDPEPILDWESRLAEIPFDFVSYRLIDGTRQAFEQTSRLVSQGGAVFWDRWSLPRRLAERREVLKDAALDRHILGQIRRCRTVWAIDSTAYGEPDSYSAREQDEARRLAKLALPAV
jgi:hypothetical protein